MSISTKRGDDGFTSLPNHVRISKSDPRVESYGTVDELISAIGFARSICEDRQLCERMKQIQRELFLLSAAIAGPEERLPAEWVDNLTSDVHRWENLPGILSDWSIPGEHRVSAAFDIARTICRRAERNVVGLIQSSIPIDPTVIAYLNRLSDALWLAGRLVELQNGVDAPLRTDAGTRWSRAW